MPEKHQFFVVVKQGVKQFLKFLFDILVENRGDVKNYRYIGYRLLIMGDLTTPMIIFGTNTETITYSISDKGLMKMKEGRPELLFGGLPINDSIYFWLLAHFDK